IWQYSEGLHDEATITALADQMATALNEIVEHCAQPGAGGRTPSDFPLAGLNQSSVDRLAGDGRTVEDIYPLTPMQTGMVFHGLVTASPDPDDAAPAPSGAYFNQVQLRLSGVFDPRALDTAWQRVVGWTPILRTRVVWDCVD